MVRYENDDATGMSRASCDCGTEIEFAWPTEDNYDGVRQRVVFVKMTSHLLRCHPDYTTNGKPRLRLKGAMAIERR